MAYRTDFVSAPAWTSLLNCGEVMRYPPYRLVFKFIGVAVNCELRKPLFVR